MGESVQYAIRVRGVLGATVLTAFPDLNPHTDDGDTVLTGGIADQAALHGVLSQIEALGIELVDVHRLEPSTDGEESAASDDYGSSDRSRTYD